MEDSPQREATADMHIRLDTFVAQAFAISRSQAARRIREGCVSVNDAATVKVSLRISAGDRVLLTTPLSTHDNPQWRVEEETPVLTILYEDPSCIIIDKPAGISVHRASSTPSSESTILDILKNRLPSSAFSLVHRLDKGTTGCLLIAKDVASCAALQQQFEQRTVHKVYLALVCGVPDPPRATIDAPLGRSLTDRTKMSLFRTSTSRSAQTAYETLGSSQGYSLIRCTPGTGRTHQIRVHLRGIGTPIIGDETYATTESRMISENLKVDSPLLHASSLTFKPLSLQDACTVTAPLHPLFARILSELDLDA